MKLGFICPNVLGHLNPMAALARQLQARNHDVVFLYSSEAAGLPCVPADEKDQVNESRPEISKMQGEDALQFASHVVMAQTESMLKNLPEVVETNDVDALVIDSVNFYAELGAMQLGMPYLHVACAAHFDYSGYTPLCLYGRPHETTPQAFARNREDVARFVKIMENASAGVKAHAEKVGLKIDWDDPSSTISPLAFITQVPRAFDYESCHWAPQFHHTGPYHDGKGREPLNFPWERLTGEPLGYASMGTLLNGRLDVFQTLVTSLAKHKDLQLVLSIGDQIDPKQIGWVPSNTIIVKRAPPLELLKLTSVCITHAGLNTVLESLAQGVPQVAIPVTFDQPGVATRIAAKKTGVTMPFEKLTSDHLSTLLGEVLDNGVYRENARRLQDIIAKTNGLSMAADIVERSFGVTKKAPLPEGAIHG